MIEHSDSAEIFEQKYRHLNDLLKYIIEHMRGSVAVHDRNMNYIYVSQKYLEEYEIVGQNIIGRHHYEVFPDLPQKWRDVHKRCLAGEVHSADEDPYQRANGKIEITRWECRPWYEADGSIGGVIVYTEIITGQKKTENELRTSRESYKAIFDDSPIGIALVDSSTGRYLKVNKAICDIVERSEEELLGLRWQDITVFDDIYPDQLQMDRLISGETDKYNIRKRYYKPSGEKIWVNLTVTNYRYTEMPCHLAMLVDITDAVNRESRVEYLSSHDHLTGLFNRIYAEDKLKLMNVVSSMPFSLLMIDINGLKLINDAFGQTRGDSVIKLTAQMLDELDLPQGSISARLGGDEFAVLMPKTDDIQAGMVRRNLIEKVTASKVDGVVLSVSVGFATVNEVSENLDDLFKLAEDRMNKYKLSEGSSMRSKTIDLIINSLHEKNSREMNHSKRVSEICVQIAEQLELSHDVVRRIRIAGLVHDIGKIGIPDDVLNKPGKLTDEEWVEIKMHSDKGYRILSAANEFSEIANYVLQHHERWDGKGYPQALKGQEIMLEARIISLADAYDAMTSDRSYRNSMSEADALSEIERCSGSQFDPVIASAFIASCQERGIDSVD